MPATTSALMALRLSGRLIVIQSACPRFSRITLFVSVIVPLTCSLLVDEHLRQDGGELQGRLRLGRSVIVATDISDRLSPAGFEARSGLALFHASSLEESGIRRVLLDIGGIALLGRILNIVVSLRRILVHLGMVTGTLWAAIGGWHRRHFIMT